MIVLMIHPNNGNPKFWAYDDIEKKCCYGSMADKPAIKICTTKSTATDKEKEGYHLIQRTITNTHDFFDALKHAAFQFCNGERFTADFNLAMNSAEKNELVERIITWVADSGVDMGSHKLAKLKPDIRQKASKKEANIPQIFMESNEDALAF